MKSYADQLDNWLLESDIVSKSGEHEGGVAGGLTRDNSPNYYYGEICGYYLVYLAGLGVRGRISDARFCKAASRTILWLREQWKGAEAPPTRVYPGKKPGYRPGESPRDNLGNNPGDWRNDFIFSFDLSMITRGLALCLDLAPALSSVWTGREVVEKLLEMRDADGCVPPVVERRGGRSFQKDAWSTRRGAHELKTAAALHISSRLPGGSPLAAAARATATRWADKEKAFLDAFHGPAHPALYAVEGALALSRQTGARTLEDMARRGVERLFQRYVNGEDDDSFSRGDVLAQLIRAGLLLNHSIPLISGLLIPELAGFIHSGGGVLFRKNVPREELIQNSWCAMFSRQAFAWWGRQGEVLSRPDFYRVYLI
ncbi:MAG: hypothetical protein GY859_05620 [Desulfobacterales bacterium]|nr:hypothetical protein [Desulfobacterales bacterium]